MLPRTSLWLGLILSIVKGSFQGGIKPQVGANPLYQPDYPRAAPQTGNLGPLGAKAGGKYPQYSQYSQYPQLNPQGYQQGPFGLQNGYGGRMGYKPVKPGYSQPSYDAAAGFGRFPQSAKRKAGYGNAAAAGGGYLGNLGQQGYGNAAAAGGGYLGNLGQQGYGGKAAKAGYRAGSYPNAGAQLGYGAGNYPNLGAQTGNASRWSECPLPACTDLFLPAPPWCYPHSLYLFYTGYGNGAANYPQGYGSKLFKPGFPAKSPKPGFGNGAGNHLNNFPQQGFGNGAGGNFPSRFQQQGISGKPSKAARTGKPPKNGYVNVAAGNAGLLPQSGVKSKASKAGLYQKPYSAGGSQAPYGSQAAYVDPAANYASTTQYGGQTTSQGVTEDVISPSAAVEGPEGVTVWGTAPPATAASPRSPKKKSYKGGYQALGNGQSTWPYGAEEPAYGLTDYYGNGYRGP
uniref:Uncharacterized protein n=1 Tax=Leptobrachium leishanense TaxID=445787 RepID=A0A8C5WHA4_9ANUR